MLVGKLVFKKSPVTRAFFFDKNYKAEFDNALLFRTCIISNKNII